MRAGGRGALSFVSYMRQGCSELSPPKLSLVCPEVLSGCHRAGSGESFLNKLSFSPCFQLYTVYWVQVSEVSSFYVFYLQTYHWKYFQKCIVPLRRLEPHCPNLVWETEASDKLMSHILLSQGCSV